MIAVFESKNVTINGNSGRFGATPTGGMTEAQYNAVIDFYKFLG